MSFLGTSFRTHIAVISRTAGQVWCQQTRLATKKAGGSSRNGRDSIGKRLGVKKFGGEVVKNGTIIIRQRGQRYRSGEATRLGRDQTIYSIKEGYVLFVWDAYRKQQYVTVSDINPNIPKQPRPVHEMSLGAMLKKRRADQLAERKLVKNKV
jgi:large subunit ribosomal protein L27